MARARSSASAWSAAMTAATRGRATTFIGLSASGAVDGARLRMLNVISLVAGEQAAGCDDFLKREAMA